MYLFLCEVKKYVIIIGIRKDSDYAYNEWLKIILSEICSVNSTCKAEVYTSKNGMIYILHPTLI